MHLYESDILGNIFAPVKCLTSEDNLVSSIGTRCEINMVASIIVLSLDKGTINPVNPYLRFWATELVSYQFDKWLEGGRNMDL